MFRKHLCDQTYLHIHIFRLHILPCCIFLLAWHCFVPIFILCIFKLWAIPNSLLHALFIFSSIRFHGSLFLPFQHCCSLAAVRGSIPNVSCGLLLFHFILRCSLFFISTHSFFVRNYFLRNILFCTSSLFFFSPFSSLFLLL